MIYEDSQIFYVVIRTQFRDSVACQIYIYISPHVNSTCKSEKPGGPMLCMGGRSPMIVNYIFF